MTDTGSGPLTNQQMRSQFEDWYLCEICDRLAYEPVQGYYLDGAAEDMWRAWQAATHLCQQVDDERR